MAVFFVRFNALDPVRGTPYFGNFEMDYATVSEALTALKQNRNIVVKRYYAVKKPTDKSVLLVTNIEERTLNIDDVNVLSLSRFKFEMVIGNQLA